MKQFVRYFCYAFICAAFVSVAFAGNLIKLDQSQTGSIPPAAVQAGYKPYCTSAGNLGGYYLPVESYLTYNASGVVSTITEIDGTSGVGTTHALATTLTYSGTSLTKTGCPILQ